MKSIIPKRVPMIYQIEAAECGAASLCMVLGYYGRHVDLGEMRKACHISRDGSRLSYIIAAAKEYGLDPRPLRVSAELKGIKLPVIVFWKYNHFLVVEKITSKWVYLCDPASGRKKITFEEFKKDYSQIALELRPNEEFKKGGKPFSTFGILLDLMKERSGILAYLCVIMLFLNLITLCIPAMTRLYVDEYLPMAGRADLSGYINTFILLLGMEFLILSTQRKLVLRFRSRESAYLSGKIFKHLLTLPSSFFQTRSHSAIVSRLSSIDNLAEFLSVQLVPMVIGLLFSIIYAVMLFTYDMVIFFTVIGLDSSILVFLVVMMNKTTHAAARASNEQVHFYGEFAQSVNLFETIKATAMEDISFSKTISSYHRYQNALQESRQNAAIMQTIPVVVPLLVQAVIISIGALQVISGKMTLGTVLASQSIAAALFTPVTELVTSFSSLQSQEANMRGLKDIENEPSDSLSTRPDSLNTGARYESVRAENVSFWYNSMLPPVVDNVSFEAKPGQRIALVGKSGSGKSTMLRLLDGTLLPQQGTVYYGNVPLMQTGRQDTAQSLSIVTQKPHVFAQTVRENISMQNPQVTFQDIKRATEDACIKNEIEDRPYGFQTVLDPVNMEFSGGQIQRMMLARALAVNPSILMLDEATSALDPLLEEKIMNNIKARGITTIIVAHRLSTIRDCDVIYVMDQGRIVEKGTHEELLKKNSIYNSLVNTQGGEQE